MFIQGCKNIQFLCSLLACALLLVCAALIVLKALHIEPSEASCDKLTYPWSPALDIIKYHWETFENHQFSIKTSYFSFRPTQEIEDAWNELLPQHPISIPADRLQSLGQLDSADDPAWVRDPGDASAILALPEYAVQLGCLNFLRQLGYRSDDNFTHLPSFQGENSLVWDRAYQCIERLRHAIMCWGDVGAVTLYYNGETTSETELFRDVSFDFGTLHYCRNFDSINQWTKENGVGAATMNNLWWGGSYGI
ncbi:hypothetical protein CBS76997_1563 [Aspergillus niger]|uniref:Uncharacterized protein n=4 Tax=Aspergillus TaxID=5052 RepID=A0A370P6X7_ASPPH|nr:uncharacterized protein BO96DRAFT_162988 [Aspergillus niger CBS 101883]XP_025520170.1 hypothetical protein BO85DRAFT_130080 [Aspergillus piperis CBS 112811]XP_035361776.1 uncharacterized protein AtWU_10780 [Aspergillus tubingensis]KAI2839223.1 hypothetical protein CBS11350_7702 [Aspergillus niger]RDK37629.1 hypothetical protein M752DRAFT_308466 [Aspergillus phoenicis ATCC 13157]KAI2894401.1 hypothetical protein CBS11852_4895 [Aspergillus niger]KAI2898064.1 hypothetical protein CBS13152_284